MKKNFYKEQILTNAIKEGRFIKKDEIQALIDKINLHTSIYRPALVKDSLSLDVDRINHTHDLIYQDLKILYTLLEDYVVRDMADFKNIIDTYIHQMKRTARAFSIRNSVEIDSTFLGETVFYKENNIALKKQARHYLIELGDIELTESSHIALLIFGTSLFGDAVRGIFKDKETEAEHIVAPYNFKEETFFIPGEPTISTYEVVLPDDYESSGKFELLLDKEISAQNNYYIYGAHNHIEIDRHALMSKQENKALYIEKPCIISFYIRDASYINFSFNKPPMHKNFVGNAINIAKKSEKIVIQCPADFVIDFNTDGALYANRVQGSAENQKLYYPFQTRMQDFLIVEHEFGSKKQFDFKIEILHNNFFKPTIDAIAVKQLMSVKESDL